MRNLLRILVVSTLTLGATGCFAISDVGRFQEDQGCDVDLDLRGFTPHADDLFELRVVKVSEDPADSTPQLAARAMLDPMGSVNAHIVMFNAAPPGHTALEFYSDEGSADRGPSNGHYDDPPNDHAWRIDNACFPASHTFIHQFDFVNLLEPTPIGGDFTLHLTRMNADSNALEVRVISMPPAGLEDTLPQRTVGLYRKAAVTESDFVIVIPGIIDEGATYRVTVWSDSTGDGLYDSPLNTDPSMRDESWIIRPQPGSSLTSLEFDHPTDFNEIEDNVVVLEP